MTDTKNAQERMLPAKLPNKELFEIPETDSQGHDIDSFISSRLKLLEEQ